MQNPNELSPIATNDLAVVTGGVHEPPDPTPSPGRGIVASAAINDALTRLLATQSAPPVPPATDGERARSARDPF